ncbi:hypothetical protein DFH06DRAFT_1144805 [Mycena polygramma]|nr:hypothetical protein DFH06DRAFT_1144805 [Mycena polygramma]
MPMDELKDGLKADAVRDLIKAEEDQSSDISDDEIPPLEDAPDDDDLPGLLAYYKTVPQSADQRPLAYVAYHYKSNGRYQALHDHYKASLMAYDVPCAVVHKAPRSDDKVACRACPPQNGMQFMSTWSAPDGGSPVLIERCQQCLNHEFGRHDGDIYRKAERGIGEYLVWRPCSQSFQTDGEAVERGWAAPASRELALKKMYNSLLVQPLLPDGGREDGEFGTAGFALHWNQLRQPHNCGAAGRTQACRSPRGSHVLNPRTVISGRVSGVKMRSVVGLPTYPTFLTAHEAFSGTQDCGKANSNGPGRGWRGLAFAKVDWRSWIGEMDEMESSITNFKSNLKSSLHIQDFKTSLDFALHVFAACIRQASYPSLPNFVTYHAMPALKPILFNGPTQDASDEFRFFGRQDSPDIEFRGFGQSALRRQKKKRATGDYHEDMRAIQARITELELGSGNSSAGASTSTARARPVPPPSHSHGPRGRPIRGPMLALEASLLEMRTARATGSGGRASARVRFSNDENAGSTRAGRREQARRGPAGRPLSNPYIIGSGSRYERSVPLKQESLWTDGAGPPTHRVGRHRYKGVVDLDDSDDAEEERVADRGVYYSADGRRRQQELLNVSHKKRRINPKDLDDVLAEWVPVPDRESEGDEGANPEPANLGKRKEYTSTVCGSSFRSYRLGSAQLQKDPMSLFRPLKKLFLDELVRHEGLGDDMDNPHCAHCNTSLDTRPPASPRAFKCDECGQFLQCETCCIAHHQRTPLHTVKVRISLSDWVLTNEEAGMEQQLLGSVHAP